MNLNKNIIIEASAGTGKTYTLVQAILRSLFEKNLPMDSLVALTFTKKAAGEMKERIAGALQAILKAKTMPAEYQSWGHRLEELQSRAQLALSAIDRANISTIHSFAYSLLKRFPLEAGIDPNAEVDEKGIHYDDFFEEAWEAWLARELGRHSPHEKEWLETLERVHLDSIKALARRLSDFDMPIFKLPISDENLAKDLAPYLKELRALIAGKPDQKATQVAVACEEVLGSAISSSPAAGGGGPIDEDVGPTKAWPAEDIRRLKFIQALARNVALRGDETLATLTLLLRPFVSAFRARILAEGYLSNSALLYLARELVRKNHEVRALLKREIRMIFVDEFQDTDPLQGELILFLAEAPAGHAKAWKDVQLEAGKLFIVGDPKQSIYRFRGADIAAYRQITELVVKQGGEENPLKKSWRAHDQIIGLVNSAFTKLITENHPISPAYQALEPLRMREDPVHQNVELRLAGSDEKHKSEEALEKEAQDAAAWIAQHVGHMPTRHRTKGIRPLAYGDIALVFRSTPAMRPFVSALRQLDIPFVVEGERYFYSAPEVTDVINLLRILDDPTDAVSLVGFLRSPLGGFTDPEILQLKEGNGLHLRKALPATLTSAAHHSAWALLQALQERVGREPLKDILRHVFDDTYLLELAARSYHRDQTVANLMKLKRLLETFAEEGVTTLRSLLAKVARFMEDDRLEGESPLADETYDAVRLMTIHKAKGLEFPVVWLPGLHAGAGGYKPTASLVYDWSQDRFGVRLGNGLQNCEKFILDQETRQREEAEEKRVLYVAMTRARERLILSGGTNLARPSKESFLAQLAGAWKIDLETVPEGDTSAGTHQLLVTRIKSAALAKDRPVAGASVPFLDRLDPAHFAAAWKARAEVCEKVMGSPIVTTPTTSVGAYPRIGVSASEEESDVAPKRRHADTPTRLGTLVHRFLEQWDFQCEKCSMPAKLEQIAKAFDAQQGLPYDEALMLEARRILADFIGSAAWDEIKGSEILGREVPFFYGTRPMMRGTIDILYRLPSGQTVIGDYKTGQTKQDYAAQGAAYQEAVRRALGEEAVFKIIALREDNPVTL